MPHLLETRDLCCAIKLVIADPYLMHGDPRGWKWRELSEDEKKNKAVEYATELQGILRGVKEIEVFHLPRPTKEVRAALEEITFADCNVYTHATTEIHDRVWIRDGTDARIIGTSFGGIGKKLAFMVPLPQEDRQAFEQELVRIRRNAAS